MSTPFGISQHLAHCHSFRDDHYYQIQSERSRILSEKETLEKVYQALLDDHRTLQTNFDDLTSEKEDVSAQLRHAQREADSRKPDSRGDAIMRAEIDRLRTELYVTVIGNTSGG